VLNISEGVPPVGARAEEIVQAYDKWWPKSRWIPRGIRRTERMQEAAFKLSERLWCPLAQTGTDGGPEVSLGEQKKEAAPLAGCGPHPSLRRAS
jgi:hypothetical protein